MCSSQVEAGKLARRAKLEIGKLAPLIGQYKGCMESLKGLPPDSIPAFMRDEACQVSAKLSNYHGMLEALMLEVA